MQTPDKGNWLENVGKALSGVGNIGKSPTKGARAGVISAPAGSTVWVWHKNTYVLATVAAALDAGEATVKLVSGGTTLERAKVEGLFDVADEGQEDLVKMNNVDAANILNTLRARHKAASNPYTSVGGIIISVNPYKWVDIYSTNVMRAHYEAFGTKELPPHVYAIAADAYKALVVNGRSQTIVTSGESGAGKTENSKQVFRFLAEVAGVQSGGGDGGVGMSDMLIHANPVLEAFGNAKTLRNDNSSRFGKLVTVLFNGSGKIVVGTAATHAHSPPSAVLRRPSSPSCRVVHRARTTRITCSRSRVRIRRKPRATPRRDLPTRHRVPSTSGA